MLLIIIIILLEFRIILQKYYEKNKEKDYHKKRFQILENRHKKLFSIYFTFFNIHKYVCMCKFTNAHLCMYVYICKVYFLYVI